MSNVKSSHSSHPKTLRFPTAWATNLRVRPKVREGLYVIHSSKKNGWAKPWVQVSQLSQGLTEFQDIPNLPRQVLPEAGLTWQPKDKGC